MTIFTKTILRRASIQCVETRGARNNPMEASFRRTNGNEQTMQRTCGGGVFCRDNVSRRGMRILPTCWMTNCGQSRSEFEQVLNDDGRWMKWTMSICSTIGLCYITPIPMTLEVSRLSLRIPDFVSIRKCLCRWNAYSSSLRGLFQALASCQTCRQCPFCKRIETKIVKLNYLR